MAGLFDRNTWYNIRFSDTDGNALQTSGNYFFGPTKQWGSAFLSPYNNTPAHDEFNFQFFPSPQNDSQYILRPANASPKNLIYLGAAQQSTFGNCGDDCSSTGVGVTNLTGSNAVWAVTPSGDGQTSYLSNNANGSNWRMAVDTSGKVPGSYLNMADAEGGTTGQMRWQFVSAGKINDKAFSTVAPGFSSETPTVIQPTATPTNSPSKSSTNIGAAVGGAVGGFAVLCLLVLALLWFLRQRKKSRQQHDESLPQYEDLHGGNGVVYKKEAADFAEHTPDGRRDGPVEAPEQNQILEAPKNAGEGMGSEPVNRGEVQELPADRESEVQKIPRRLSNV